MHTDAPRDAAGPPSPAPQRQPPAPPQHQFPEGFPRLGLSVDAVRLFVARHRDAIAEGATTSDVCHAVIKPATAPAGWQCVPTLIDAERRWYKHAYRRSDPAGGSAEQAQDAVPPGTRSYCELLRDDAATAHLVGQATVFFSHAWLFRFENVVEAMQAFVDGSDSSGAVFFWFDCFSIDEHATQALPLEWWSTTFRDAIRAIGHTAMMLSPWGAPLPLRRAWCLWEIYCTVATGSAFSVCYGKAEREAFEFAIERDVTAVLTSLSAIDVGKSEAGSPTDLEMIHSTVLREVPGACWGPCARCISPACSRHAVTAAMRVTHCAVLRRARIQVASRRLMRSSPNRFVRWCCL
jgi:hypothetical protein